MSSKADTQTLDLNALLRFAAVVERGGFSAAARTLGLPRQALHRSVAALEASAGTPLLERGGGQVRPTDAGRRLFSHATAILFEARAAQSSLAEARQRPRGRLRLTAPHLFAEEFLAGPIQTFLAAWPEVQIDADLTTVRRELMQDELDLAIRLGPRPTESGYVVSLGELAQVCCAAPSYLARGRPQAQPHDLAQNDVLVYGQIRQHIKWRFERDGQSLEVPLSPRLRVDSAHIALSACRAGLGIVRLPAFVCASDLATGSLRALFPEWRIPAAGIWAFSTSRLDKSAMLRAFVDVVRKSLEASSPSTLPRSGIHLHSRR